MSFAESLRPTERLSEEPQGVPFELAGTCLESGSDLIDLATQLRSLGNVGAWHSAQTRYMPFSQGQIKATVPNDCLICPWKLEPANVF